MRWRRWPDRARAEARLMGRVLAGLFFAGACLAGLTVLLPHPAAANVAGLLIIVAVAYTVAGLLAWSAGTVSVGVLQVALAWGSTLITGVAYFSGQRPSPLVFFYLWVFLYSAYFFDRRQAIQQIGYVGAAYAALLIVAPPPSDAATWWLVGMGSLLVAAVVVTVTRARSERLIAQLHEAARTDPLTGLLNRRGFRECLDLELERARRGRTPLALVSGDLDLFKAINDQLGHPAGDAVLRRTAEVLRQGVRSIDAAARIGGEEFALVLSGLDASAAFVAVERLREALRDAFGGEAMPVTMSFGVAGYPQHGETAGSLLRTSDEALYLAKQTGRDRTVIHDVAHAPADGNAHEVAVERFIGVLVDLAEMVDVRFSGSARHSETVGRYAERIAQELGLGDTHAARVKLGGLLHDIGKSAIPDAILQKAGGLTDEEFALIKQHPDLGAQLLQHPGLADIREWVATHHERPDGRGYPRGLTGAELSLESQILAVADSYEAMTCDRAYRRSLGPDAARAELRRCADQQFDATVVDAFLTVLEREANPTATPTRRGRNPIPAT